MATNVRSIQIIHENESIYVKMDILDADYPPVLYTMYLVNKEYFLEAYEMVINDEQLYYYETDYEDEKILVFENEDDSISIEMWAFEIAYPHIMKAMYINNDATFLTAIETVLKGFVDKYLENVEDLSEGNYLN